MSKGEKFDFNIGWYELWMKQSKEFFETADKNLKDMFSKGTPVNPEEHMKQIRQWLDSLKNQWEFIQLSDDQKAMQTYWKNMTKMCLDASDKMLEEWIKRSREKDPVKSVRELYEIWLNCCHEVYQKSLQSKTYQDAYGEFMNAAFKFWKAGMPK